MVIDLLIATFRIRLSATGSIKILPGERFSAFIAEENGPPDVIINVSSSEELIPQGAERVFEAPLMEETFSGAELTVKPFWSVWCDNSRVYVKIASEANAAGPVLVMGDSANEWDLFMNSEEAQVDPLPYPLDGLVLYYLTAMKGAVMIHASAVNAGGRGWIFSGRSGRGKTTLARLFDNRGVEVIHDDRVILAKKDGSWFIYSTPVYRNDVPRSVKLDHIWLIDHGKSNMSVPLNGAIASAMVLSNCIQQNWSAEMTKALLLQIEDITGSVSVSKLDFMPDTTICDYLFLRKDEKMSSAFEASLALLSEGQPVCISVGGTSMWPVIKSGDKVIIEPVRRPLLKGAVVAIMRDGGFVVHRITDISLNGTDNIYTTQGDASQKADPVIKGEEIAGVVNEIVRNTRRRKVKKRMFPVCINRLFAKLSGIKLNLLPQRTHELHSEGSKNTL